MRFRDSNWKRRRSEFCEEFILFREDYLINLVFSKFCFRLLRIIYNNYVLKIGRRRVSLARVGLFLMRTIGLDDFLRKNEMFLKTLLKVSKFYVGCFWQHFYYWIQKNLCRTWVRFDVFWGILRRIFIILDLRVQILLRVFLLWYHKKEDFRE